MIQLIHNTNYLKQRNHVYSLGMKIGKVILQKTNHDAAYLISFFHSFRSVQKGRPSETLPTANSSLQNPSKMQEIRPF